MNGISSTEEFFTALYGDLAGQKLLIQKCKPAPLPGKPDNVYWDTYAPVSVAKAASGALTLDGNATEGQGIFFRVTTVGPDWDGKDCKLTARTCAERGSCHGKHRGGSKDSTFSPGIFLDIDTRHESGHVDQLKPETWEQFATVLEACEAPALSALVASSNHGYYPAWLHDGLAPADAEHARVQKGVHYLISQWSQHLGMGKVDSTFDHARVIRVPGTHNRKPAYGPDYPLCRVVFLDGPRHSVQELAAWLERAPRPPGSGRPSAPRASTTARTDDLFDDAGPAEMTRAKARTEIEKCLKTISTCDGEMDRQIGGAAKRIGKFCAAGAIDEQRARERMAEAIERNTTDRPGFLQSNADWAAPIIDRAFSDGMAEWEEHRPFTVAAKASGRPKVDFGPVPEATGNELILGNEGEQARWLREHIGREKLSGYFLRAGEIVHTVCEGEDGYVAPVDPEDDNGAVQIRLATVHHIPARVTHSYDCVKLVKDRESGEWRKVPALFSSAAASTAVNAPDMMPNLRKLSGVVETPTLRPDGTLLTEPGYDAATRLLHVPAPGLTVPAIPEVPTEIDVKNAVELLDEAFGQFPWVTENDRTNYYGLLLTPILRKYIPAPCKLFGIGAHQQGSGKTFLADALRTIHGGVLRSSWSQEETEVKKETMAILATTTGAVVVVDNVDRVTKSAFLAMMLTAKGPLTERELGASRNLVAANDRVWVLTGNNLQMGGDLVRRTVSVLIDPDQANPESRQFRIGDFPEWIERRRGDLLAALLTMVRYWVSAGRPAPSYRQGQGDTDSFRVWSCAVAGILELAGVEGQFDTRSGQRVASANEGDAELSEFLAGVWEDKQGEPWTVKDLFAGAEDAFDDAYGYSRRKYQGEEHFPGCVLAKSANGELSMKRTMGAYLSNHIGRYVPGDGFSYVLRPAGKAGGSGNRAQFRVERRELR